MPQMPTFPFATPIPKVRQADRSPKPVFVLGVYASAVHARRLDDEGHTINWSRASASTLDPSSPRETARSSFPAHQLPDTTAGSSDVVFPASSASDFIKEQSFEIDGVALFI